MDHPSVERIPLMPKVPFPIKKKEFRCSTCSKKFKNETSLNYHSMFHTAEEKPSETPSSTTSAPVSSVPTPSLPTPVKPTPKLGPVSCNSSDSDSDNDSRHLSLKHISNSVKRISESQKKLKLKRQSESETEPKIAKKPPAKFLLECEKCKKKFKDSLAFEYHKITFHIQSERSSPGGSEPSRRSDKPSQSKSDITSSDRPSKRKSECHLEEINNKKQKILSEKTDKIKSKCLTGIFRKTQRQVSDHSEDDSQTVIQSIKSTLSLMHRKRKQRSPPVTGKRSIYREDSDSDQIEEEKRKVIRKEKPHQRKTNFSDSESDSSELEKIPKKSIAKKNLSNKTIEKDFQSHSIDAILRSKDDLKEKKKLVKDVKFKGISAKKPKTVTSDSEPEIVKKEEKPEIKIEIVDSEDESTKIRESLLSTKNSREKCEHCNKTFKNILVLNYHQLHCEPPHTSKSTSNSVEKTILSSKKTLESPADKILKKLKVKTPEKNKEPDSSTKKLASIAVNNSKLKGLVVKKKENCGKFVTKEEKISPKVKRCDVSVKKINEVTMRKFKDDLLSVPDAKKPMKASPVVKKALTKQTAGSGKNNSVPSLGKGFKPRCEYCGKKYGDIMALNYHKITFHVEEKETKLFSASAYHEQMSFDKNVLKLNNVEVRRHSLEAISESTNQKIVKEDAKKVINKSKPKKVALQKFVEKPRPVVKRTPMEKPKSIPEPIKIQDPGQTFSGYCICDKPERDDMLG